MGKYSERLLGGEDARMVATNQDPLLAKGTSPGAQALSSQPADIDVIRQASFPRTIQGRRNIYAKNRFPDLPQNEAVKRYGYDDDGRLFYVGDDGGYYYENPPLSLDRGDFLRQAGETVASSVGPATNVLPALPAAAIGSTGIGVPAAAALSAGGEALRQQRAESYGADEGYSIPMMALEGTVGAVGQGVGNLATSALNTRRFATDAGQLARPAPFDAATDPTMGQMTRQQMGERVAGGSEKFNVPTTMAEQTGLPSLVARQKTLMSYPQASELLDNFYNVRNEKVRNALYRAFESVSPLASGAQARAQGVKASEGIISREKFILQNKARPLYQKAEEVTGVNVTDLIKELKSSLPRAKGSARGAVEQTIKDLQITVKRKGRNVSVPDDSLIGLDAAQKALFDRINGLKKETQGAAAKQLGDVHKRLINVLEDASPDYKQARAIYATDRPAITELEQSVIGEAARLKGRKESGITNIMFNPRFSSAETVKSARKAFFDAGSEAEWNGIVRSWLQETLESVPSSTTGATVNLGGAFRKKIAGDATKAKIFKEALGGGENTKNFFWLMDTLSATGRAMGKESFTAFAQQAQKEISRESTGLTAPLIESLEVWNTPSRIAGYMKAIQTDNYAARLAEILTTKTGKEAMKEISKLSPRSRSGITALTGLLTKSGFESAVSALNRPSEGMLPDIELVQPGEKIPYSQRLLEIN